MQGKYSLVSGNITPVFLKAFVPRCFSPSCESKVSSESSRTFMPPTVIQTSRPLKRPGVILSHVIDLSPIRQFLATTSEALNRKCNRRFHLHSPPANLLLQCSVVQRLRQGKGWWFRLSRSLLPG